jgi:hypothetical protein
LKRNDEIAQENPVPLRTSAYLLLLLLGLTLSARAQDVILLSGNKPCDMDGDAKAPHIRELNLLKNRYTFPARKDFYRSVTLGDFLKPGNDETRFRTDRAVKIRAYVANVKVGGKETCNCREKDPLYRDTHIELVLNPKDTAESRRFIAEVTPRMRTLMAQKGVDWKTSTLQKELTGRWITIEGWLMFDTEHDRQSENTRPGHPGNWRATAWEIHPVTGIEVVKPRGRTRPAPL